MDNSKRENISVEMPMYLNQAIDQLSRDCGKSKSEVIVSAVVRVLEQDSQTSLVGRFKSWLEESKN